MVHPGGDVPQGDAKTAEPHLYRIWRTMCATTSAGEQSHSFRSITDLASLDHPTPFGRGSKIRTDLASLGDAKSACSPLPLF